MTRTLTLLSLLVSVYAFAQDSNESTSNPDYRTQSTGDFSVAGIWLPPATANKVVEGTTYIFPNWTGVYTVLGTDGNSHQLHNLNYNILTKKIEAYVSKDSVFQYDLGQIDYVIPAHNKIKYKVVNTPNIKGLLHEMYKGKEVSFYKETTVRLEDGVVNPLTKSMLTNDTYKKGTVYYILKNGVYNKVKLNKSGILGQLGDKKDQVSAYVKEKKLSYSDESEVLAIIRYYGSI